MNLMQIGIDYLMVIHNDLMLIIWIIVNYLIIIWFWWFESHNYCNYLIQHIIIKHLRKLLEINGLYLIMIGIDYLILIQ